MKSVDKKSLAYAQKKVARIKDFYRHLFLFLIINVLVLGVVWLLDWYLWYTFIFFTCVWGMSIVIQALFAYGYNPLMGKNWEQRQLEKILEEEQNQSL
jgi:hypothetical protein